MDLEKEYTKETGLSPIIDNYMYSDGYYTDKYVEWLEAKIKFLIENS